MRRILEELYYGGINPVEVCGKKKEVCAACHVKVDESERIFLSKLTEEARAEYEQLMVDRLECEDMEHYQIYADGFETGVRLMVEILGGSKSGVKEM